MSKRTQGHGPSTQKNKWTPRQRDTNVYIYILTNKEHESVTTEQAGEQMPMTARQRKKGKTGWRCCRKHTGVPQSSASLPETCTEESCRAMENERERSVWIRSDSTSSSLRAIPPFFPPRLPPFIGQEGSRLGINFLPTESNYLGSSYVPNSLLYTTKNVHARRAGPRALVHRLRLGTVFFTTA